MANAWQELTEAHLTELLTAAYGGDRASNLRFAQLMQDEQAGRHGITARGIRQRLAAQGKLTAKRERLLSQTESLSQSL